MKEEEYKDDTVVTIEKSTITVQDGTGANDQSLWVAQFMFIRREMKNLKESLV